MKVLNLIMVFFMAAVFVACGKTAPTGPDMPGGSFNGRVIGNPDSLAVPGAEVRIPGLPAITTNGNGEFSVSNSPSSFFELAVSAGGFWNKKTWSNRINGPVKIVRDSPPTDLAFFRQFARNARGSTGLLSIIHQTGPRSFYIKTTDEYGNEIPETTIEAIKNVIYHSYPAQSGFQVLGIETGHENKVGTSSGPIVVNFTSDPNYQYCGEAGWLSYVKIAYNVRNCTCGSPLGLSLSVFAHELGHMNGTFHHDQTGLMNDLNNYCTRGIDYSPTEQHHAMILNSLPLGNTDDGGEYPDNDPQSTMSLSRRSLSSGVAGGEVIRCFQ